jgi:hypothetical protein
MSRICQGIVVQGDKCNPEIQFRRGTFYPE